MGVDYRRVIPRDLFNEASLMKCLGNLHIKTGQWHPKVLMLHHSNAFNIMQDESDGSIYSGCISVFINNVTYDHWRPLNSREAWPLWLRERNDPDAEEFQAFTDEGDLSPELMALIEGA
jgi:hypothetical protein